MPRLSPARIAFYTSTLGFSALVAERALLASPSWGVLAGAGLGWSTLATVLLAMLVVAATLESVFALCLGCQVFALLMRAGVIPESTCEACADIWSRRPQPSRS